MIEVAVIGAGHWGPNLIRNFNNRQDSVVRSAIDNAEQRLAIIKKRFPDMRAQPKPRRRSAMSGSTRS